LRKWRLSCEAGRREEGGSSSLPHPRNCSRSGAADFFCSEGTPHILRRNVAGGCLSPSCLSTLAMFFCGRLAFLLLVGVGASTSYSPEDCLEVTVEACGGAVVETLVAGAYVPYDGTCGNSGGRQAYYNEASERFLYHSNSGSMWYIGSTCGGSSGTANGNAGDYPFLNTGGLWACAPAGAYSGASIEVTGHL